MSSGATTATVAIPSSRARAKDAQRDLAAVRDEQLPDQAFFPGLSRFCGIERALDRTVQLERTRAELLRKPVPLHEADAVLARDRSAEPQRELEERFRELRRERELSSSSAASRNDVCRLPSPAWPHEQAGTPRLPTDLERLLDRLAEPVEWHCDVLARLAAALGVDDERQTVAPAPQGGDLLRRSGA